MATSEESFAAWFTALGLSRECANIEDLADGVLMFEVMVRICPSRFDLSSIKQNVEDNWALRSTNLKKLVRGLEEYYGMELGQGVSFASIDVSAIAKEKNTTEIVKLVEGVLGCTVQCENRNDFIIGIQGLDAQYQQNLMMAIQSVMERASNAPQVSQSAGDDGDKVAELAEKLDDAMRDKASLEASYSDLQRRIDELNEENQALKQEASSAVDSARRKDMEESSGQREDKEAFRREMMTLEMDKEKLQQQLEDKNKELSRLKMDMAQQTDRLEDEVRKQADELDIARSKASQLVKAEAQLAKYKQKLGDAGGLRQQMKELEEQNSQYLDRVLDMESTIKGGEVVKQTLDKYKDQVVELESDNSNLKIRLAVKEDEVKKIREDMEVTNQAKEFLEEELDAAKANQEQLDAHDGMGGGFGGMGGGIGSELGEMGGTGGMGGGMSDKEKCRRLERELKELKASGGDPMAASALEDGQRVRKRLEDQLAESAKKVAGVEQERDEMQNMVTALQDAKGSGESSDSTINSENKRRIDELHAANANLQRQMRETENAAKVEKEKLHRQVDEARAQARQAQLAGSPASPKATKIAVSNPDQEAEAAILNMQIEELKKQLKNKEGSINELSSDKQKLENYTKKTLHAVQAKYMVAMATHKDQIKEKDAKIGRLERRLKEDKAAQKREEDLLMSSFYEVGMELQRRMMVSGGTESSASWAGRMRTEQSNNRSKMAGR
jgi:protein HOOK3